MDQSSLENIQKQEEVKQILAKYLLRGRKTKKEMQEYAKKAKALQNYDEKYIVNAIQYLQECRYINDKEYAMLFVEDSVNLKKDSRKDIYMKLLKKGVAKEYIQDALKHYEKDLNEKEVLLVYNTLVRKNFKDLEYKKKMGTISYLYQKGYSSYAINKAKEKYNFDIEDGII